MILSTENFPSSCKAKLTLSCFGVVLVHVLYRFTNMFTMKIVLKTTANGAFLDLCAELSGLSETQRFQSVYGGHSFVFSAYLDDIYPGGYKEVTIFGLTLNDNHSVPQLFCFLHFADTNTCEFAPAVVDRHRNAFGKRFVSATFRCPVVHHGALAAVSLINKGDTFLSNKMVVVHHVDAYRKSVVLPLKFVVCVAPLQNVYNDTNQLLVAVEFNRLLGAERFVFYNHSVSPAVDVLLRSLTAEGVAEVIQWPLPTLHIHYYGQFVAVNDCVFRNARRAKFVVNTDLDEFIVPQQTDSWADLSSQVLERYPDVGAFNVRTTHFYSNAANHTNVVAKLDFVRNRNILPLLSTNRSTRIWPSGKLSKLIVRPDCVSHMGVHKIWGLKEPCKTMNLAQDLALVYHYARKPKYVHPISYKTDLSVYKYKHELLDLMAKRFNSTGTVQTKKSDRKYV